MKDTFRELGRVLLIFVVSSLGGALVGFVVDTAHRLGGHLRGVNLPDIVVVGTIGGFLCSGLIVPLVWRRSLTRSLSACWGVGVTGAAVIGYLFGEQPGMVVGGVLAVVTAAVCYRVLPVTFFIAIDARCTGCGYDLRGSYTRRCPECGAKAPR